MNCEMLTGTKTSFPLYGYMNNNDASLFYQHSTMLQSYPQNRPSTKEERRDQRPSIAEKLTAELVAPQL